MEGGFEKEGNFLPPFLKEGGGGFKSSTIPLYKRAGIG